MKKFKLLTVLFLSSSLLFAVSEGMNFNAIDTNSDGVVSSSEFDFAKNLTMQAKLEEGKTLKNAGKSPTFEQIDTDSNGVISQEEMTTQQNTMRQERIAEKKTNQIRNYHMSILNGNGNMGIKGNGNSSNGRNGGNGSGRGNGGGNGANGKGK